MNEIQASQGLVLRKTVYSETSLIFVLLTRDRGLQSFLARGALRQGKKRFPAIDLFRCLRVQFRPQCGRELQTARDIEMLADFDSLAKIPAHFRTASWLSRLVHRNAMPEDPVPKLYDATYCAFQRLSEERLSSCRPVWLAVVFTLLEEQGVLPDLSGKPDQKRSLSYMLDYAANRDVPPPTYPDETWMALADWARGYLDANQFYVPDGLANID